MSNMKTLPKRPDTISDLFPLPGEPGLTYSLPDKKVLFVRRRKNGDYCYNTNEGGKPLKIINRGCFASAEEVDFDWSMR